MRLTNNLVASKYLKNLNSNMSAMSDVTEKVAAHRKYMNASEDPATALKAFQVRRNLSRLSQYNTNISEINGLTTEMESSIKEINDMVQNALSKVMQGKTGTYSETDRNTLAETLRSYQSEILSIVNTKFSGDYVFGGSTTKEIPFTLNGGELFYKGQNVDTGTFTEENRYIDIGMGLKTDASGNVDPQTAFDVAYSGANLLGSGTSGGISNNVYNLLGDLADMFKNNDLTNVQAYYDKLVQGGDEIMVQYAAIGEKSAFADYLSSRVTTQQTNMKQKQNSLESMNTAEGAILYNETEVAYNACLQIGDGILKATLLDYLD